jgi:hypothetical protein
MNEGFFDLVSSRRLPVFFAFLNDKARFTTSNRDYNSVL